MPVEAAARVAHGQTVHLKGGSTCRLRKEETRTHRLWRLEGRAYGHMLCGQTVEEAIYVDSGGALRQTIEVGRQRVRDDEMQTAEVGEPETVRCGQR